MGDALVPILAIVGLYLFSGLRVLREYGRAVYFFLGRSWGAKGPGLIYLPPLFAKMQKVSLRVVAMDVRPQDVITRDNISLKVTAVLYMRVRDSVKAVIGVENYLYATSQLAQTTLRSVLGETELDELLMNREKINDILKNIIDKRTEDWGVEVSAVEVKDVDLPPEMKRAIARQAEAERERRAKVINAEGELQASENLRQALLEEQTRALVEPAARGGPLAWLAGPAALTAGRVVPGERATVERALAGWLERNELLQVKRRFTDHTTWEPKAGAFASIQRALGAGGKKFALARAAEIAGSAAQLETGFCHAQLRADVRNLRRQRLVGAAVLFAAGALATALAPALGVLLPWAALPVVAAASLALVYARGHRRDSE